MGAGLLFRYSNYVSPIMLCPIACGAVLTFRCFLGPQRSCFHSPFSLRSRSAFWIHDKLLQTWTLPAACACSCLSHTPGQNSAGSSDFSSLFQRKNQRSSVAQTTPEKDFYKTPYKIQAIAFFFFFLIYF